MSSEREYDEIATPGPTDSRAVCQDRAGAHGLQASN